MIFYIIPIQKMMIHGLHQKILGVLQKKRWFGIADPNSDKCSLDVEDSSLNESWNKFFHYIHSKEFLENMSKFSNDK